MFHIDQIIAFFLNLFKLQCQDPDIEENACQFVPVPEESGVEPVYDLRIQCGATVKTRRMSIRQLGEQVESKSTCYKVIFDDPLVVKIPPKPIVDFKSYLDQINKERHVSNRLMPDIPCVSPSISAILTKIPGFVEDKNLSPQALEEKCIRLLSSNPRLQTHVKIGGSFVFFMNLSKNVFFNQTIEQIHEEKTRVQKEIIKNAFLFDHLDTFETIYGEDHQDVFFAVKGLYKQFDEAMDALLTRFNIMGALPEYKKKEWFFTVLAREQPVLEEKGIPQGFFKAAQTMTEKLLEQKKQVVHQYRKTVKSFVRNKIFENNKKAIEGLTINILNLIYHIKNKSIAVRDLKPDNIYLAAKIQDSPYQYWDPESYSLGLIDLETATDFQDATAPVLDQPLLAGTPSYMTPSHIFKNNVLQAVFGDDIRRIFYMQDWFAALSMIYNVATGKLLFVKTAKLISQILQMKKKALALHKPLSKVFKRVSMGFWEMAETEFYEKLHAEKERFSSLHIHIPKPVVHMFQEELGLEKTVLTAAMEHYITTHPLFEDIRSELMHMSLYELSQYRILWEKGMIGSDMPDPERQKLNGALKKLEILKHHVESHSQIRSILSRPVSCDDLMAYLFHRVMLAMFRHTWVFKEKKDA